MSLTKTDLNQIKEIIKEVLNDDIQTKADAINYYAKLIKNKDLEMAAAEFDSEKEYGDMGLTKDYQIINKKYLNSKELEEFETLIDYDDIDPAGGHGLYSHE